jgi:hypothetical protein
LTRGVPTALSASNAFGCCVLAEAPFDLRYETISELRYEREREREREQRSERANQGEEGTERGWESGRREQV